MVPPLFINSFFEDFPSIVKIIWILAIVFFFIMISLIFLLKVTRFRLRKKEVFIKARSKEYEKRIVDYLYLNEDTQELNSSQQEFIGKLKLSLKKSLDRRIFITALLKLKGEVSGDMVGVINQLYKELGLDKQAMSKLHSKRWHIVAIGIRDLRRFKVFDAQNEVAKCINHSKMEVRRQAYLYFINLFGFKGLDFLDDLTSTISIWDQIGILDALQGVKLEGVPKAQKWLRSKNDYVILLALELVKVYNLRETQKELLHLIQHRNKEIRLKTIRVLSYLYIAEAKQELIDAYENLNVKEQIAVFELLENIGAREEKPFVLKHISSKVFEIKVLALKILKQIDTPKFVGLKNEIDVLANLKVFNYLENNP